VRTACSRTGDEKQIRCARAREIRFGARFVIAGTDTNYVLAGARQETGALRAIKM
jgi:hypothetical protein